MLAFRKVVLAGCVAVALAALVTVPAAAEGDEIPPTCASASVHDIACVVSLKDGVHAVVQVPDVLCVRVDALSSVTTADAHVSVPCPSERRAVKCPCEVRPASASPVRTAPSPVTVASDLVVTH